MWSCEDSTVVCALISIPLSAESTFFSRQANVQQTRGLSTTSAAADASDTGNVEGKVVSDWHDGGLRPAGALASRLASAVASFTVGSTDGA